VVNHASLIGHDSSKIEFLADSILPEISGFGYLKIDSLIIGSEVYSKLFVDVNQIKLVNGNYSQGNVILNLNKTIIDEFNDSKISGGTIRKNIFPEPNIFTNSGNLGLQLLYTENLDSTTLFRKNQTIYTTEQYSINRIYSLSDSTNKISELNFYYFNNELENLDPEKLQVYTSTDLLEWKPQQTLSRNTASGFIHSKVEGFAQYFTLFEEIPNESFFIPNGFSPNDDGVNDYFEILGLEEYPNNKLIVFDGIGTILYEASPYQNKWDGFVQSGSISADNGKLNTGTYYYFFYKDSDKNSDVIKGFIELRSGR